MLINIIYELFFPSNTNQINIFQTRQKKKIQLFPNHNNINIIISLINSTLLFNQFSSIKTKKPISFVPIMASKGENNFGGKLVDESMIILRKRIHEMNMIEQSYEAPSNWMEWEKSCYHTNYDSILCEAMRILQTNLMNTRPSAALGAMAFVAISVPFSSFLVFLHLLEFARSVLCGVHLA